MHTLLVFASLTNAVSAWHLRHSTSNIGSDRIIPQWISDHFSFSNHKITQQQVSDLGNGLRLNVTHSGDERTFPTRGDWLKVHYDGSLSTTGKRFDSSRDRGEPLSFTVGKGEVIGGWDIGLMKMSLGERGVLHVPANLGYGARGAGDGDIPPNSDLDFDVELLAINGREVQTPSAPEQGYSEYGGDVQHKNGETAVDDWHAEYPTTQPKTKSKTKSGASHGCFVSRWYVTVVAVLLAHGVIRA
jgi:FKBP-type peptidyl-prolyl cis-trans isomerase 2